MRKYFRITLTDGRVFDRDVPPSILASNLTMKANNYVLLKAAQEISMSGFCENVAAPVPRWIAASFIRHVDIVFDESLTIKK